MANFFVFFANDDIKPAAVWAKCLNGSVRSDLIYLENATELPLARPNS